MASWEPLHKRRRVGDRHLKVHVGEADVASDPRASLAADTRYSVEPASLVPRRGAGCAVASCHKLSATAAPARRQR